MKRKPVVPDALALQIAAYAKEKRCSEQAVLEAAIGLGLNMLRMRSDQPMTVVRRRAEDARLTRGE